MPALSARDHPLKKTRHEQRREGEENAGCSRALLREIAPLLRAAARAGEKESKRDGKEGKGERVEEAKTFGSRQNERGGGISPC